MHLSLKLEGQGEGSQDEEGERTDVVLLAAGQAQEHEEDYNLFETIILVLPLEVHLLAEIFE